MKSGGRIMVKIKGHPRANKNGIYEHTAIVETVIGHILPNGAEVHHVDGDMTNNDKSNLVVCQNRTYHKLLHQRQRAYYTCGHADWRKCWICQQYSPIQELYINKGNIRHRFCHNLYRAIARRR